MKVAAVTTAWHDEETIRGTLACLEPFVDDHFVLLSEAPFNGEDLPPDKTEEICREFPNVTVIRGVWPEHIQRNLGIELSKNYDWMIGFDADEMMTGRDIARLKSYLRDAKHDAIGFVSKVYWRTTDYRFEPYPNHCKVCIIRPGSGVKYTDKQCVNAPFETLHYDDFPNVTHHHLSWCEPKNILRKVTHYNHAKEFDGKTWYEEFYLGWHFGESVYQPFGTKWEAVYDPLPRELAEYLCSQIV